MGTSGNVEQIWSKLADFELNIDESSADEVEDLCIFAKSFAAWAREMTAPILKSPSVDQIHLGMLLNSIQYHEMRAILPKAHRNHVSDQGHTCVFHLYERTFHLLKIKLLSLPKHTGLMLPQPPPQAPPPSLLQGTIIGLSE